MRKNFRLHIFLVLFLFANVAQAKEVFKVIVLGCGGGPRENNLSSYLIAPIESNNYVALDAGTLLEGIYIANQKKSFSDIKPDPNINLAFEIQILQNHIKAYLISHTHLDHVTGLVINSPADSKKPIFGISSTIDYITKNLFNWKIWPNFGSEGKKPLNQYEYKELKLQKKVSIENLGITVEPFLLSHPGGYPSTAFLIEYNDHYLLYFGDTSPDALEPKKHIQEIWKKVAPLIRQKKLHGIFLECSYTDREQPNKLFGHLDPTYMMEELYRLATLVNPTNPQKSLKKVKVVVTHIKDSLVKGPSSAELIEEELKKINDLKIQFIFPEQGERFEL